MDFRPLISVDPYQLSGLLAEERQDWIEALNWDPYDAQQLLLKYVGQRMLPGLAAFDGQRLVGYTYYLTRNRVGVIGTLYFSRSYRQSGLAHDLLSETMTCLRDLAVVDRIETQIFPFGVDLVPIFRNSGFQFYRRHYLCKDLTAAPAAPPHDRTKNRGDFHLIPWRPQYMEKSAMIIQAGYTSSIDLEICREYGSYESCLTFIRNLTSNPGCGTFLPTASFVAVDSNQLLSGVLMASRLLPTTALIAQIAVLPGYQGCGFGAALMDCSLGSLRQMGYTQVCLSVSEENERAFHWYRQLGFEPRRELLAFVWSR